MNFSSLSNAWLMNLLLLDNLSQMMISSLIFLLDLARSMIPWPPPFPHGVILSVWRNSSLCFSYVNHGSIIIINYFLLLPTWSPPHPSNSIANLAPFNTQIVIEVTIVVGATEDVLTFMIPPTHHPLYVRYASNQVTVLANAIIALIYLIRLHLIPRTSHRLYLLHTICNQIKNGIPTRGQLIISPMT